MVNEQQIEDAYQDVIRNTDRVLDSGLSMEIAKENLERGILFATLEGRIQGKNEGERKAVAMQLFQQDYDSLDAKELGYKINSKELSLARLRLDMLRDIIRIEELAKK